MWGERHHFGWLLTHACLGLLGVFWKTSWNELAGSTGCPAAQRRCLEGRQPARARGGHLHLQHSFAGHAGVCIFRPCVGRCHGAVVPPRGSGRVLLLRFTKGNLLLVHPQVLHADATLSELCDHLGQGLPEDSDETLATRSALPLFCVDVSRMQAGCCGPRGTCVKTRAAQATCLCPSCQRPALRPSASVWVLRPAWPRGRLGLQKGVDTQVFDAGALRVDRVYRRGVLRVASSPPGGGLSRRTGALYTPAEPVASSPCTLEVCCNTETDVVEMSMVVESAGPSAPACPSSPWSLCAPT